MIQALTNLAVAVLVAAIGVYWAYDDVYSVTMFRALMACVAVSGVLGALGIGGLMREAETGIRRALLRRKLGFQDLDCYVLVEDPQPTL